MICSLCFHRIILARLYFLCASPVSRLDFRPPGRGGAARLSRLGSRSRRARGGRPVPVVDVCTISISLERFGAATAHGRRARHHATGPAKRHGAHNNRHNSERVPSDVAGARHTGTQRDGRRVRRHRAPPSLCIVCQPLASPVSPVPRHNNAAQLSPRPVCDAAPTARSSAGASSYLPCPFCCCCGRQPPRETRAAPRTPPSGAHCPRRGWAPSRARGRPHRRSRS